MREKGVVPGSADDHDARGAGQGQHVIERGGQISDDRHDRVARSVEELLNLDNKEVPGKMMAMKMAYEVRDARVGSLPPDGTAVVVTMHDQDGKYWITDVKGQLKP